MKKQAILFIICYILTSISLVSGQCSFTISSTNVFCYGESNGTATANPMTGIPPFTFLWNTTPTQDSSTAINLPVGTYTVYVTDSAGCTVTDSVTISQPDLLIDTIISVDTICLGNCATLNAAVTGGILPYMYLLTPGTGTEPLIPPYSVCPPSTTSYTVTVTDSKGCIASFSKIIYVVPCLGIVQNESVTPINIYPNPTTYSFTIDCFNHQNLNLFIYNLVGKLVLQKKLNTQKNEINISLLATGMYIIKVKGADWTRQQKIIKE